MNTPSFQEMLEASHTFPGEYVFRVIGVNHPDHPELRGVLEQHLQAAGLEALRIETHDSANGNYTTYRLHVHARSAEQVIELTAIFQKTAGVRMVM